MRLSNSLCALGLAASASAVSEAAIYTFDRATNPSRTGGAAPSLSVENFRLLLAYRLGLSQYHKLGNANEEVLLQLLNDYGGTHKSLLDGAIGGEPQRLLVVVEGLDEPEDLFDSSYEPSLRMLDPPSSNANLQLATDFLVQDRHRRRASDLCAQYPSEALLSGGFSGGKHLKGCGNIQAIMTTQDGYYDLSALDLIDASLSSVEATFERTVHPSDLEGLTGAFHVSLLSTIAENDSEGTASASYQATLARLRRVVSGIANSDKIESTIVALPLRNGNVKRSASSYGSYTVPAILRARESKDGAALKDTTSRPSLKTFPQASLMANHSSNATTPKTTIPFCYYSEKTCNAATNACSGHGACYKKYADHVSADETADECWACRCQATVLKTSTGSNKTTYWGGPACQKKDISTPFFLLAGFSIVIVAVIAWAVGLLYSIGQDDLPSVLSAGVAPSSRK